MLEQNLVAKPTGLLNRFFDKELIEKVQEIALDGFYFRETGLDHIESELFEHAIENAWHPHQEAAGLDYLRALRTVPQASRPDVLLDEDIAFIHELFEKYPVGFRISTRV